MTAQVPAPQGCPRLAAQAGRQAGGNRGQQQRCMHGCYPYGLQHARNTCRLASDLEASPKERQGGCNGTGGLREASGDKWAVSSKVAASIQQLRQEKRLQAGEVQKALLAPGADGAGKKRKHEEARG